jgi:hypothetical protein
MLHLGDVGTAFWNAAIAGHTFWTVVLGETSPGPAIPVLTTFVSSTIGKHTTTLGISVVIASGWILSVILSERGSPSLPHIMSTYSHGTLFHA